MNEVIHSFNSNPETLSSIELLDLVNAARQDHGENAIRRNDFHARIADELAGDHYETFVVQNPNGTTTAAYSLNHEQCLLVSMRESKSVRRTVLKRLKELEQSAIQDAVPKTMPEALRLAADLAEKNEQLTMVARQQGDRIKSLQNLFESGVTPFEFAKRLNGVNCQKINAELHRRGWLYRDSFDCWRASSKARDLYLTERSGRMERSDGRVMVTATPVLLQRGAAYLHKLYLHEQLPMKKTWDGQFSHDKSIGGEA